MEYNFDRKILENLNNDEVLSLLESIRDNYSFYDDYVRYPYPHNIYKFQLSNGDVRIYLYAPCGDPYEKKWTWVNSVVYGKDNFYNKYTEIVRMRKLNTLELI